MSTIYYSKFTNEDIQVHFRRLLDKIPVSLQQKSMHFHKEEDRFRSVVGALLIQYSYNQLSKGDDALALLEKDKYSRPFVQGNIDFNLSHSGNYILCGCSATMRVGVDVEKIASLSILDFNFIFHPNELVALAQAKNPLNLFYDIWVKKEAITKADGRGLGCTLEGIDTLNTPTDCGGVKWYTQLLPLDKDYAAAIASNLLDDSYSLKEVAIPDL